VDGTRRAVRAGGVEELSERSGEPVNGPAEVPQLAARRFLALLELGHTGKRFIPISAQSIDLLEELWHRGLIVTHCPASASRPVISRRAASSASQAGPM
jgi:hypothetical protein